MLKRPTDHIIQDLKKGRISPKTFLERGLNELKTILRQNNGDLNGNIWGPEEKYIEGIETLKKMNTDEELLEDYSHQHEKLFNNSEIEPNQKTIIGRKFFEWCAKRKNLENGETPLSKKSHHKNNNGNIYERQPVFIPGISAIPTNEYAP